MAQHKKLFITKLVKKNHRIPFFHQVFEKDFQRFYSHDENEQQVESIFRMYNIAEMTPQKLLETKEAHVHDNGTPCESVCLCGPMTGLYADPTTIDGEPFSDGSCTFFNLVKTIEDTEDANILLSLNEHNFPEYAEHLKYNKQHNISIEEFFVDADDHWNPINPL